MATIEITPNEACMWLDFAAAKRTNLEKRRDSTEKDILLSAIDAFIEKLNAAALADKPEA